MRKSSSCFDIFWGTPCSFHMLGFAGGASAPGSVVGFSTLSFLDNWVIEVIACRASFSRCFMRKSSSCFDIFWGTPCSFHMLGFACGGADVPPSVIVFVAFI
jgi:hypothetical protein